MLGGDFLIDLTGRRFGWLTMVSEAPREYTKGGKSKRMWNCLCDCGKTVVVNDGSLKRGNTKSCGCYRKYANKVRCNKHGLSKSKLYSVWGSMKDRCYSKNCKQYKDYGGRGITICDEWRSDFFTFYKWAVNNGYKEGLTIERKDVNGNYCPENCCWITKEEQAKNKTNCHFITYNGETRTLSEWSRELHIDRGTVRKHEKILGNGEEAIEKVLNSKVHKRLFG